MPILHQSRTARVTEEAGVITLAPRSGPLLALAAAMLAAGALALYLARAPLPGDGALGRLLSWSGAVVAACGALMGLLAAAERGLRTCRLDLHRGSLRRGATRLRLAEVAAPRVVRTAFGDRDLFLLTVEVRGRQLPLISGHDEGAMAHLAKELGERMRAAGARAAERGPPPAPPRALRHLPGLVLVGIGAAWTGSAAALARDLLWTPHGSRHGPLLWPLGLWIAAAGLAELAGLSRARWLRGGPAWRRAALTAAWLASYLIACWR